MASLTLMSPHTITNMPPARAPLRDAPSAVLNSPLRGTSTVLLGTKRARPATHALDENAARDDVLGAKRRFVETDEPGVKLHGLPPKRSAQANSLQRRLEAARVPVSHAPARSKLIVEQTGMRQWQKHHRRLFPSFVFYFDNVPEDARRKLSVRIRQLGAREEAFFQKSVTHVVTARSIPSTDVSNASSSSGLRSPTKDQNGSTRTINPLLLDNNQRHAHKLNFEPPMGRRQPTNNDILLKARDMGMKIWSIDKIQRVMSALGTDDADSTSTDPRQPHGKERPTREAELSRLLKEDKRYMSSDKTWMIDMQQFRGYFLYVRDMDERTKPVMVRDYAKPQSKEHGKWPQLRVSQQGRCPFIQDVPTRRTTEPSRKPEIEQDGSRKRPVVVDASQHIDKVNSRAALIERPNPPEMPPPAHMKRSSTDQLPLYGSTQAALRRMPRFVQGEPVASGVQPSNITSAVRSQMISSTAAAPGGKSGSTRELNNLKRKVLEKNGTSAIGLWDSARSAVNQDVNQDVNRPTKRKHLDEITEEDLAPTKHTTRKKRVVEKEAKPGYCENCRDKYDDFDDHIVSKEHRKFAVNDDHFRDLDALLAKLQRV